MLNSWSDAWLGTVPTYYSSLFKQNVKKKKKVILKFVFKAGTCSVDASYTVTKNLYLKS